MHKYKTYLLLVSSFVALAWLPLGVIESLGFRPADAEAEILDHLANKDYGVPYGLTQAFKKVPLANRAATVQALGDFAKAYTKSQVGIAAYAKRLGGSPPNPEQAAQYDAIAKDMIANLKETEKALAEMPADQRKMMEPSLAGTRQAIKAYEQMRDDAKYGVRPVSRIKEMLEEFLKDTDKIPWDAKLVASGSRKIFADPKLEGMDRQRKFYFRCGRETIEASRLYAQTWLKELQ